MYLVTTVLGLTNAPLVMYWQNLASPAGLVIGPPAIFLTTIALIAGFLLMVVWPLGPVAMPVAWLAGVSLTISGLSAARRRAARHWRMPHA